MKAFWRRIGGTLRGTFVLQAEEYRASIQGLNLFFGAILGVGFVGAEEMAMGDYMALLAVTACAVMLILTVSFSRRRLYSVLQLAVMMAALWYIFVHAPFVVGIPNTLFPTLAVWSLLATVTEFTPREKRD